jgi:hypothetical protein
MKKPDIILCAVIVTAAVLLLFRGGATGGELTARIYVAGVEVSADEVGTNTIRITPDGAYMLASTCRNQDCVRMGKITRPGQIIVCLPNRVMVILEGDREEGGLDAVAG